MKFTVPATFFHLSIALAGAEPAPVISASFYSFDYVPGHETVYVQTGAGSYGELRLSKANIVGPVSAVAIDGALRIHDKPRAVDGKITQPVLSTARLPDGIKRALVVLFPIGNKGESTYRSLVMNHDLQDFPLGIYRLINLSPHPIRGAVARAFVEAKPGGIANLEPAGKAGAVVPVRFEYFENDRWNLLTETRCAIRKDRRWLTCIYQDPATGRMNIRSIPDRTTTVPARRKPAAE
jgi:hypothetical protein